MLLLMVVPPLPASLEESPVGGPLLWRDPAVKNKGTNFFPVVYFSRVPNLPNQKRNSKRALGDLGADVFQFYDWRKPNHTSRKPRRIHPG